MAIIGHFSTHDEGFVGNIITLSVQAKDVRIRTVDPDNRAENAPSHLVFVGQAEIGAAWNKRAKDGREYLAIKLDDPSFVAPIYANLHETAEGSFELIWQRPNLSRR